VSLAALAREIRAHKGAGCGFEPCETCTQLVPGEGSEQARIVLVGEAPGATEDRDGRPFAGRAGALLDLLLERAGLARGDVWITNVVKARPPGNRDPRVGEVAHHRPWLERELDLLAPELVVALGRHALAWLAPDLRITRDHGTIHAVDGRAVLPWFHPSAGLRSPDTRALLEADADALGDHAIVTP
jgi:DNA polymerase